jgi:gliding motility-associated-like protein
MKKIYLFIFLIVIGLSQNQSVNANSYTLPSNKLFAPPAAQTIAFTAFATPQTFGAADITLVATATSGLPVSYSSSNTDVATIVGTVGAYKIHLIGPGTAVITASQAGDGVRFNAAPNQTKNLTVNAGPIAVISAASFPNAAPALQSADLALPATSNYSAATAPNNPIIYTITAGTAATIVNNRLHMLGTGAVTIQATQPGSGRFPDAVAVNTTYTIGAPLAPLFATAIPSKALGSLDFDPGATLATTTPWVSTITYTNTSPAAPGNTAFSIINNKVHLLAVAPSTQITATITYPIAAGGTGTVTATNSTLVITAAVTAFSPVLNFTSPGSRAYTNVDIPLIATSTSTSSAPITFSITGGTAQSSVTLVNNNIHFIPTTTAVPLAPNNTVIITADQGGVPAGVAGSLPADASQTLTITAPTIAITSPGNKLTNSPDFAVVTTASLANIPVTVSVSPATLATIVNGNVHLTGATGTVTINATQSAAAIAAGYPAPADATPITFTVGAPANPVITFAAIGTRTFTNSDISTFATSGAATPLATSTSTSTNPIIFTSSNPAVAIVTNILTLGAVTPGTGYTNGTYTNVPLTGGSGTGVLATVVVANGVVSTVTIPTPIGSGYLAGDVLSATAANLGGTGSGFNIPVLIVAGNFHFVGAPAAPNNTTIITASQGGGSAGTLLLPPDVLNIFTVTPPLISFPTIGTKTYSSLDFAPGATTSNTAYPLYYTSSNANVATVNNVITGTLTGGTGYTTGSYSNIALTGSTGTGATAVTLVVTGGVVASLTVNSPTAYAVGDILTLTTPASLGAGTGFQFVVTGISSSVLRFNRNVPIAPNNTTIITASQGGGAAGIPVGYLNTFAYFVKGTAYTNGTYLSVPLTGGTGTGALATVVVSGGVVSSVAVTNGGSGYTIGDVLSCNATSVGGTGSGFSITITNITAIPADVTQLLTLTAPVINFPALGTKVFTSTDLNPGATGAYLSSNSIASVTLTAGTGYANGVYYAVPLTGGTGTGATATITVLGGVVTSALITSGGSLYNVSNVLTTANTNLGGVGSGFSLVVSAVSASLPVTYTSSNLAVATIVNNFIHFVGTGTTTITASQNAPAGLNLGAVVLPASTSQTLTVTQPVITFAPVGTRALGSNDVSPGATSTISTPINYTSSNLAVATINNNGVGSFNSQVRGTGYVRGIYSNVPLTGGTGTGALATVTVDIVGQSFVSNVLVSTTYGITAVLITSNGSGYAVGDVLSVDPASVGGTPTGSTVAPSGFSITVNSIGSFIHFTSSGNTNITATQGGGAAGTTSLPPDVTQALTVTRPVITFLPLANTLVTPTDLNPGATSTLANTPITYTLSPGTASSVAQVLTNSITSVTPVTGFNNGGNYTIGTYSPVPLSYPVGVTGPGTGATAQIVVIGNSVASVTIISGGTGYKVNDVLTALTSLIGGGTGTGFYTTVATVGGNIHFVGSPAAPANTITVTASQGGGATGTALLPADVAQTLTVLPYAITFPALQTRTLSSADLIPGASSTLTNTTITYTSSNSAVATIVGGNIHFIGAGTSVITATQGGGASGTPLLPPDVTRTLTVTNPVITFQALPTVLSTNTTDIVPVASSTVANIPITYTSANTAVATIISGNVLVNGNIHMVSVGTSTITASQGGGASGLTGFITGLGAITPGSSYTANTYTGVALTGGTGTGAKATIVIANGSISSVVITAGGSGYLIGDNLTAAAASVGGTGTGFNVVVANTTALPADVTQLYTAVQATITFPALGSKPYSNIDVTPGASSPISTITPLNYTSSNAAVATINYYPSFATPLTGGSGYTNGTYTNVSLIYTFHGTVLPPPVVGTANVVISGGVVTSVSPVASSIAASLPPAGTVVTILTSNIGATGSGFSTTVTSGGGFIHYTPNTPAAPNNTTTITASQPLSGMANATSVLTVTAPAITFPTIGTVAYTNVDLNPGATSSVNTVPITYTSSNPAIATIVNGQIHFLKGGNGTTDIEATQQNSPVGTLAPATGTLPADVKQTITVSGGPAITFTSAQLPASKQFTTTDLAPGATSTYTNSVIAYTSSNTNVATIVGGNIHFIATGSTNITASQGGGASGTAILPADVTLPLAVTAPQITGLAPTRTLAITSVDVPTGAVSTVTNVAITYTSSDATIATIVNGNIHFVGAIGNVIIKASQGGGATGTTTLPADVSQTLTVTAPAITFTGPLSKPFAVTDFTPVATSSLSTLPITFTSSDPNVATIVNGNIHYTGLGNTTITASQQSAAIAAGYPAPPDVSVILTVTAPTLAFTALGSKPYNSSDLGLISSVTSSLNQTAPITFTSSDPTVATIVNNQLHYVGIGSCIITASQSAYTGIGAPASVTSTLTVTPAVITILPVTTFGTIIVGVPDILFTSTSTLSTSAVPITYTTSDPNVATIAGGNSIHYISPGTCTITASQVTNANYAPVPTVVTLTLVNTAQASTPVITFPALGTRQYTNNADIVPGATSSNASLSLTYTSSNPAVATIVNGNIHLTPPNIVNGVVTYASPNTTTITASAGGGFSGIPGLLPADVSTVLTVTPGAIIFPTLGAQKFSSVDLPPGATSTVTVVNANNIATPIAYTSSDATVATIVNGNIHFVGLGSTTITASLGNVFVADVSQNLQVVAPVISFPLTNTRAYQTIDVTPGATSSLTTNPIIYTSSNPAVVSIVNGNLHFNGVGVVTITASQNAIGNSGIPLSVAQTLTVTAPTLTFASTLTRAFSLTDVDPGATSTLATVPITYTSSNPAVVSIVNNRLHFNIPTSNLTGNTTVITAIQLGTGNIPTQTALQTLTVGQFLYAPNGFTKAYGDPDFSPDVSNYGSGYPVSYALATASPATNTSVLIIGANGSTLHITGPGTTNFLASQAGDASASAVANITQTLTVTQAPLTITPKNVTVPYGSPLIPFPLIYDGFKSATGGLPLDDSTKFTTQAVVSLLLPASFNGKAGINGSFGTIPAGTYTLTVGGAVSTLYTFTYGTGTLTIVPAVQTLTWPGLTTITKTFTDPDFDPLARSTGDPIVYTSDNPLVATIVNGQIHIVGVGTANIKASISPTSGNYTGSASITKVLTVGPGTQTITVANITAINRGAANYSPNAVASSGLTVTITSDDPTIVNVVGNTIQPLHVGTTLLTFSQPGNANYLPAANVVLYVQVVDPSGQPVKVDQAVSPNGDGINDFLYIEGMQNYPDNHVKIINRNGDKVYAHTGYNNKDVVFNGKDDSGHQLPAGTYFYLIDWNTGSDKNHITGYFVFY